MPDSDGAGEKSEGWEAEGAEERLECRMAEMRRVVTVEVWRRGEVVGMWTGGNDVSLRELGV